MKKLFLVLAVVLMSATPVFAKAKAPVPTGSVVFFEINTANIARAKAFYGALLGWTFPATQEADFAYITTPNAHGGFALNPNHPGGSSVVLYAQVEAITKSYNQALDLGAKAVVAPQAIPGVGSIAIFKDLDGNCFGLFSDEVKP
jgi:predicted enzyme related to lactoylglutathione lyase